MDGNNSPTTSSSSSSNVIPHHPTLVEKFNYKMAIQNDRRILFERRNNAQTCSQLLVAKFVKKDEMETAMMENIEIHRQTWHFDRKCLEIINNDNAGLEQKLSEKINLNEMSDVEVVKQMSPTPPMPKYFLEKQMEICMTPEDEQPSMTIDDVRYPLVLEGRMEHIFTLTLKNGQTFICGVEPRCDSKLKFNCLELGTSLRRDVGHVEICECGCHENPPNIREMFDCHNGEWLGAGEFGNVVTGVDLRQQPNRPIAVKMINTGVNHVKTHVRLPKWAEDSPCVVRILDCFFTNNTIYFMMEKLGKNMLQHLMSCENHRLNERMTKFFIRQVLAGLDYLHQLSIVHGNLKLENILLVNDNDVFPQVKVTDFGIRRIIKGKCFQRNVIVSSAEYVASPKFIFFYENSQQFINKFPTISMKIPNNLKTFPTI